MFKNALALKKIPASCCCLISILQDRGHALENIASEISVSQRTLRRALAGEKISYKTQSALTNYYLSILASTDLT